jgi:glycerate kinase
MNYLIVTDSFARGIRAQDLSSLLARQLRTELPKTRTEQIIQFPIIDGGEGMVEGLVTMLLGSFLEVEATDALGGQVVVPIGFVGDNGSIAVLRLGSVVRIEKPDVKETLVNGTTYGIGELIRDSLDEGAFSVLLGLDEPIARDAGLGLAAALGVKFYDAAGELIALDKPESDLLDRIARIDATGRSFETLSARIFLARANASSSFAGLHASQAEAIEKSLVRLNSILKRDCNQEVDLSSVDTSGSCVEFGLQAFFTTEVHEGSGLMLQASGIEQKLGDGSEFHILLAGENVSSVIGEGASAAGARIVEIADRQKLPITLLLNATPGKPEIEEIKLLHPAIKEILSLPEAPLFQAPLSTNAGDEEIRRDQKMRIEKLSLKLFKSVPARRSAAPTSKQAAKAARLQ